MAMQRWVIKDKLTGNYIPDPRGWYNNRGGSWVEPDPDKNKTRLFKTRRAATNFLAQWLRGQHVPDYDYEDGFRYTIGATPKAVVTRIKDDMEIIEINIKLP